MDFLSFLWGNLDDVFAVLFAVQLAAAAVVKLTPTTKDDAIVAKVLSLLETLAGVLAVRRKTVK